MPGVPRRVRTQCPAERSRGHRLGLQLRPAGAVQGGPRQDLPHGFGAARTETHLLTLGRVRPGRLPGSEALGFDGRGISQGLEPMIVSVAGETCFADSGAMLQRLGRVASARHAG